jgi:hypothetical protein
MGVSLEKLQQDAPQLVSTVSMVKQISTENGLDPNHNTAAVVATFDLSGSNEMGSNRNYSGGLMQRVGDLALSAGFAFDDDGEVPFSYFHDRAIDLGNITPATSHGFVERTWRNHSMGGTRYMAALDWIIDSVGLSGVDLGRTSDPLEVRASAPHPAFAIFATDGEPTDSHGDIYEKLRRMSQLPIFVQFIGVGNHDFQFLKTLDTLEGRLIDNAGFFDSKDVISGAPAPQKKLFGRRHNSAETPVNASVEEKILRSMLSEFTQYYPQARSRGLIQA